MRNGARLAAAAALVTAVVVAAPSASARDVDQVFRVPAGGTYHLQGHGWGHGHGMSQYGARGAARDGLSWKQILGFYYPGTTMTATKSRIRVQITADTSPDVVVSPVDGLHVRDLTSKSTYRLPVIDGVRRWRLNPHGAANRVGYLTEAWHTWRTMPGDAELYAPRHTLRLWTPSGDRVYRGALRAAAPTKGSSDRDTVNVLSLDDYVQGVVAAEMPSSWERAALRAQAVAARTFAMFSLAGKGSSSYQICDTYLCQVYGGVQSETARTNAAVEATAGMVLTYDGKPAFTQFSSSSGGWTSAGSVPYLVSQADPYERDSGNPYSNWSVDVSAGAIQRAYPSVGTLRSIAVTEREGGGDWQGRVWDLTLHGSKRDLTVSGDSFRATFGLRSTYFTFGDSPIIKRWKRIGGADSVVGDVSGYERHVRGGAAQSFAHGTIFWSRSTGARELYGAILGAYRAADGPRSALGLPTTPNRTTDTGQRADFEHGWITWNSTTNLTKVHLP
jgi:stage II sporulation protein D